MKTKGNDVAKGKVYVFATPKTQWMIENLEPGELPYTYKIKDWDYGCEGQVRVCEYEVEIPVPGGVDLTALCIEQLKEQIDGIKKESAEQIRDLEARISALALLEHNPVGDGEGSDNIIIHDDSGLGGDNNWYAPGGSD